MCGGSFPDISKEIKFLKIVGISLLVIVAGCLVTYVALQFF